MKKVYLLVFSFLLAWSQLLAQCPNLNIGSNCNDPLITFDGFMGEGFSANPTDGQLCSNHWAVTGLSDGDLDFGGEATSGDYTGTTTGGGVGGGGLYAYDGGMGDLALWIQPTGGDFTQGTLTLRVQNNSGTTLNTIQVAYDLLVLNDQDRANSFNFSYSEDDVTYIEVPELDFTSPEAADDMLMLINQSTTISSITLNDGEFIYLRWTGDDVSGGGSRDEFGLDNIVVCQAVASAGISVTPTSGLQTSEDGTSDQFSVVLNTQPTSDVTIQLNSDNTDEGTVAPSNLTFTSANWNTPQIVTITGVDDMDADGDITYNIILNSAVSSDADYNGIDPDDVSVINLDDEIVISTIASLTQEDADGVATSLGVEATIQGVVYRSDLRGGNGIQFTIIDGTGGIGVFNFNDVASYVVQEGDELQITGEISQFNGLTQIQPTSIQVLSMGNALIEPSVVTALDESTESQYIKIECVELVDASEWEGGGNNFNVNFTDGTNTFVVRIDNDTELSNTSAPVGKVDIIGIGGQFDGSSPFTDGYQLFAFNDSDISEAACLAGACMLTGAGLEVSVCNDNGTDDTVADDFYTFSLNPVGVNLGTTYSVSGDVMATNVAYGSATTFNNSGNNFLISAGNLTLTITDDASGDCQIVDLEVVAPMSCSVALADVCINEVLYDADENDGSGGEYIELSGTAGEDLSCYVLSDGDFGIVLPSGTTIPQDGILLIANSTTLGNNGDASLIDVDLNSCNCATGATISLTNGGEFVALFAPDNTLIDGIIFEEDVDGNNNGPNGQIITPTNPNGCTNGDLTIAAIPDYDNPPSPWNYLGTDVGNGISIERSEDCGGLWQESDMNSPGVSNSLLICNLASAGLEVSACNNNGTNTDSSDDFFTFSLNPTGSNLGATYSVSGDVTANNISYGSATTFDNSGNNFLISDGNLTITITDDASGDCQIVDLQVTAPSSCSNNLNVCFTDAGNFTNFVVTNETNSGNVGAWSEQFMNYQLNGFNGGASGAVEYWAISPKSNYGNASVINLLFDTFEDFDQTDLEVLWSVDYAGTGDPNAANWNLLKTLVGPEQGGTDFTGSEVIDISGISDLAGFFVAFRYADDDGDYSRWRISNITIEADDCTPSGCAITQLVALSAECQANTANQDEVIVSIQYTGLDDNATIENNGAGTISGDDPSMVENGTITITLLEGQDWSIRITDLDDGCDLSLSGTAPTCDPCDQAMANINEFHYDNFGTDEGEFVEIFVADPQPTNLGDYQIALYNGNGGGTYNTITLAELGVPSTDDLGAYYVWELPANGIQNGAPDGIALGGPCGLIEFLSYEGTFSATNGIAEGVESTDIGVSEPAPIGSSIQLIDGEWIVGDGFNTKGGVNLFCDIEIASITQACQDETDGFDDLVVVTVTYSGIDANTILTNTGAGILEGDKPAEVENGTFTITLNENEEWSFTITGGACDISESGKAQSCPRCLEDDCDFFNIVPVTLNEEGDNWFCSGGFYTANGFCGSPCESDLWLVSNALLYDNATTASLVFDATEDFDGSSLVVYYSTDYNGFNRGADVEAATWIEIQTLTESTPMVQVDLTFEDEPIYIAIQYVADGATGSTSAWQVSNIAIDADDCSNTSICTISDITYTEGACSDNGTPDIGDDTFAAEVTVTFENAPTTGTLDLFGTIVEQVDVANLDSPNSHTFSLTLPADGAIIDFSAKFSDNPVCFLTNPAIATAPFGCNELTNCETVFISEYAEQTDGNNKALELYNPSHQTIDLSNDSYIIAIYEQGNGEIASPNSTIELTGELLPNNTLVIVDNNATDATLVGKANLLETLIFDGDDAIILWRGGVGGEILDAIGKLGEAPLALNWIAMVGTEFVATKDDVIRRLSAVQTGENNPNDDFFGAMVEWESVGLPDFSGFGFHENDCQLCDFSITNVVVSPEFCLGDNDGSITIETDAYSIAGTDLPLEYSIDGNNFQESNTFENLVPGNYTVTVRAKFIEDCEETTNITIPVGPSIVIDGVNTTPETCPDSNDGTISIEALFAGSTLEYSIDGGMTFQVSGIFEGLDGGTYDIVIRSTQSQTCDATTTATVVTIPDNDAPTFDCPDNIIVNTDAGLCSAVINNLGLSNVLDNCDANPAIRYETTGATTITGNGDISGTAFELGTTSVTYTVADKFGNEASCSFEIVVSDAEAPMPDICPTDIIITNANDFYRNGGIATWTPPMFTDNCTEITDLSLFNNLDPGFLADLGLTEIEYTATDESGNVGVCEFDFVVQDAQITDPCNCLDNRSTPNTNDGQFAETVTVYSNTGETWTIQSVTGLFQAPAGVFPPAAGTRYPLNPYTVGDVLTESPAGSGVYVLNGLHVEGIGYQVTVTNGTLTLSIGNLCNYDVACAGDIAMPSNGVANAQYQINCGTDRGFFDDGGALFAYEDSQAETDIITICSDDPARNVVKVTFTNFDIAAGDQLIAYDGNNLAAMPFAGAGTGIGVASAPGGSEVLASCTNISGCITFEFIKNGDGVAGAGWQANVTCEDRNRVFTCPTVDTYSTIANNCNTASGFVIEMPVYIDCGVARVPNITIPSCSGAGIVITPDLANNQVTLDNLPVGVHTIIFSDPNYPNERCETTVSVYPKSLACNDDVNVSLTNDCVVILTPDLLLEDPCNIANVTYNVFFTNSNVNQIGQTVEGYPIVDFTGVDCGTKLDMKVERSIADVCGGLGLEDACWGQVVIEDKVAPQLGGNEIYTIDCFFDTENLIDLLPTNGDAKTIDLAPSRVNTAEVDRGDLQGIFANPLVINEVNNTNFPITENCNAEYAFGEWQEFVFDCSETSANANTDLYQELLTANGNLIAVNIRDFFDPAMNGVPIRSMFKTYIRAITAVDFCGNESAPAFQIIRVEQPEIVAPLPEIQLGCGDSYDPIDIYNEWASDPWNNFRLSYMLPNFDATPITIAADFENTVLELTPALQALLPSLPATIRLSDLVNNDLDFELFNLVDPRMKDAAGNPIMDANGNIVPDRSVVPAYPEHAECGYAIDWDDSNEIYTCPQSYKVFREWTIYNWCDGHLELIDLIPQVIKVGDTQAPQIVDSNGDGNRDAGDIYFLLGTPSGAYDCAANVQVSFEADDDCSGILQASVAINGTNPTDMFVIENGNTFEVPDVPVGQVFSFVLTLVDECGNTRIYNGSRAIEDEIPPVAICEQFKTVSMGIDCEVEIPATAFDDGSYDNCGQVTFAVARMDELEAAGFLFGASSLDNFFFFDGDEDIFKPSVRFTQADMNGCSGTVQAVFRVADGTARDLNNDGDFEDILTSVSEASINVDINRDGDLDDVIDYVKEAPNYNYCMVEVMLQDKIPPVAEERTIALTCFDTLTTLISEALSQDDPNAAIQEVFNTAGEFSDPANALYLLNEGDNCGNLSVLVDRLDNDAYDISCRGGSFSMVYQLVDACGNVSLPASLTVTFDNDFHDWSMEFPEDEVFFCDNRISSRRLEPTEFYVPDRPSRGILQYNNGCDYWSMEVKTERFEAADDACYQLVHNYHFINWCTWNPNHTEPAIVERPDSLIDRQVVIGYTDQYINTSALMGVEFDRNDRDSIISPLGRDGLNDIDDRRDDDRYRTDLSRGFDGDFVLIEQYDRPYNDVTVYEVFEFVEDTLTGGITQIDTIPTWYVSAQEYGNFIYRQIIRVYDRTAPTIEVEAYEPFCGGGDDNGSDACTAPVEVIFTIDDLCETTETLNLDYQLKPFNENAIDDPFGQIESLGEGRFRIFGDYPIQAGGDTTLHSFVITVQDACFNKEELEVPFQVVDCKAPTPKCVFGLSVDLMPTGQVTLSADEFNKGSFDFCTPQDQLVITFANPMIHPDSITRTFRCLDEEIGRVPVELWVMDLAGNVAYCETFVEIQDNRNNSECPNGNIGASIAGTIATEMDITVESVDIQLSGHAEANDQTGESGWYNFANLQPAYDYSVTPHKDDDPLNGVSTYDLVLISKHILNVEPLDSPYKLIAADINNSGSITTLDMVQLRKLILTIDETFTHNTSWRFIPSDYEFENPSNPFAEDFPEVANMNDIDPTDYTIDFVAVKVGDVNGSAIPNTAMVEGRSFAGTAQFNVTSERLDDELLAVHFEPNQLLEGYQFTLMYDQAHLKLNSMLEGVVKPNQMAHFDDKTITVSWNGESIQERAFSLIFEVKEEMELAKAIQLKATRTSSEAYNSIGNLLNLELRYEDQLAGAYKLHQNTPNPFKEATTIVFELPNSMEAALSVHDMRGQLVYQTKQYFKSGKHNLTIDQKQLPAGVLYYTLSTDEFTATKRMILMK